MAIRCCRVIGIQSRCPLDAAVEIWPAPDMNSTIYSCDIHVGDCIPDHPVVVAPIGETTETEVRRLLERSR